MGGMSHRGAAWQDRSMGCLADLPCLPHPPPPPPLPLPLHRPCFCSWPAHPQLPHPESSCGGGVPEAADHRQVSVPHEPTTCEMLVGILPAMWIPGQASPPHERHALPGTPAADTKAHRRPCRLHACHVRSDANTLAHYCRPVSEIAAELGQTHRDIIAASGKFEDVRLGYWRGINFKPKPPPMPPPPAPVDSAPGDRQAPQPAKDNGR